MCTDEFNIKIQQFDAYYAPKYKVERPLSVMFTYTLSAMIVYGIISTYKTFFCNAILIKIIKQKMFSFPDVPQS